MGFPLKCGHEKCYCGANEIHKRVALGKKRIAQGGLT
jgi:hypothetical protein